MKLPLSITTIPSRPDFSPSSVLLKNYYSLMIVPLIQPAVTTANAKLVIKMNVGLETTFGAGESDPSFVISDGSRFIGMLTPDKNNYKNVAPCYGIEEPVDQL